MFTGIIVAIGKVISVQPKSGDCRLTVNVGKMPFDDVGLGDSIAVNGVCLTVVELGGDYFRADVSRETLSRTTLVQVAAGTPVNLELALTPSSRMGGHIVSGHVDGVGEIVEKKSDARSFRFKIKAPETLAKYIAEKGSICVDGISLTVNEVDGSVFCVNIVPHTMQETTLGVSKPGGKVNLEVDLLARYIERLLQGEKAAHDHGVTHDLLKKTGFAD